MAFDLSIVKSEPLETWYEDEITPNMQGQATLPEQGLSDVPVPGPTTVPLNLMIKHVDSGPVTVKIEPGEEWTSDSTQGVPGLQGNCFRPSGQLTPQIEGPTEESGISGLQHQDYALSGTRMLPLNEDYICTRDDEREDQNHAGEMQSEEFCHFSPANSTATDSFSISGQQEPFANALDLSAHDFNPGGPEGNYTALRPSSQIFQNMGKQSNSPYYALTQTNTAYHVCICGKHFSSQSALAVHEANTCRHNEKPNFHSGVRDIVPTPAYVCICGKHFSSQSELDMHKSHVHNDEQNFSSASGEPQVLFLTPNSSLVEPPIQSNMSMPVAKIKSNARGNKTARKAKETIRNKRRKNNVARISSQSEKSDKNWRPYSLTTQKKKPGWKKINSRKSSYACFCGKSFTSEKRLHNHEVKNHGSGNETLSKQDKKPHICPECGDAYRVPSRLRAHLFRSHGIGNEEHIVGLSKNHPCSECDKKFHSKARVRNHLYRVHQIGDESNAYRGKKSHPCSQCDRVFLGPARLKYHEFKAHGLADPSSLPQIPKRYICLTCGKTFSSKKRHKHHLFKEHGEGDSSNFFQQEKKHPCEDCNERFYTPSRLRMHQFKAHGKGDASQLPRLPRRHGCTICGKSLSSAARLRRHAYYSHGIGEEPIVQMPVKKHMCQLCGSTFWKPSRLQLHLYKDHGEGDPPEETTNAPCKCPICGKEVSSQHVLSRHVNNHLQYEQHQKNPDSELPVSSQSPDNQGQSFTSPADSSSDSLRELPPEFEKPFQIFTCDFCEKCFKTMTSLKSHRLVHYPKSIECNLCDKTFRRQSHFTYHMRTHTGEKPYRCVSCGKGFTTAQLLKYHSAIHSDDRPFLCTVCGKTFKSKSSMNRHSFTHSEDRRFQCTECGKSFKKSSNLKRHFKRVHEEVLDEEVNYDLIAELSGIREDSGSYDEDEINYDQLDQDLDEDGNSSDSERDSDGFSDDTDDDDDDIGLPFSSVEGGNMRPFLKGRFPPVGSKSTGQNSLDPDTSDQSNPSDSDSDATVPTAADDQRLLDTPEGSPPEIISEKTVSMKTISCVLDQNSLPVEAMPNS